MNYYIATALSVVTAIFTMAAAWVPDKRKSFVLQTAQCMVYAAASYFYGVYSTIPSMILCAGRNWLISKEKFTTAVCVPFCIVAGALGIISNNAGFVGYISVFATIEFSVGLCIFKSLIASKWNILFNLAVWILYDCLILDFASLVMDGIAAGVTVAAIVRIMKVR